jgi:hypothetical protein
MNYSEFDRHENMSSDTRSEIINLLRELMIDKKINNKNYEEISNFLFGLFDGYLYKGLLTSASKLNAKLELRLTNLYMLCNTYPKLSTI